MCSLGAHLPVNYIFIQCLPQDPGSHDLTPRMYIIELLFTESIEKGMATHSSILAWKNPMDSEVC